MPLQVDDEYWESEDPNLAFRQPPDKPCRKAFFVCWIKLTQIAGFALRTLVGTFDGVDGDLLTLIVHRSVCDWKVENPSRFGGDSVARRNAFTVERGTVSVGGGTPTLS